jgi:hypothetical protein
MIAPGTLVRVSRSNRRPVFGSVVTTRTDPRHGEIVEYRDARNSSLHVALAADVRIEHGRRRST